MSREQRYNAIVLKRQAFGEADEIVTFFTQEAGKIRGMAKSSKLPTSRLRQGLQPLFVSKVTLAGSGKLPKIIQAAPVETHAELQKHPERVAAWFVAAEIVLKGTPDEQRNEELFAILMEFLRVLNRAEISAGAVESALAKFKIEVLGAIGLGIWYPADAAVAKEGVRPQFFSNSKGGFMNTRVAVDAVPISSQTWESFLRLQRTPFADLAALPSVDTFLPQLLSSFVTYYLEREIKSEQFLGSSDVKDSL